jgi:ParB family chromosome partitioning protein
MPLFKKEDRRQILELPVHSIQPNPHQPRKNFSQPELDELARSIAQLGVIQPLSVRRVGSSWQLIAGERRLRAAKLAGLSTVPCVEVTADNATSSLMALVENIQRKDLDFLDEAQALRRLIDAYHLSQEEAAAKVGKSQSAVANKLRLLKLPPDVLDQLRSSGCTERHARALLRLDTPELQRKAARHVIDQQLTVAKTEDYVKRLAKPQKKRAKPIYRTRDVRLFLNTIQKGLSIMNSAGVDASCGKEETEQEILLTIHIPK